MDSIASALLFPASATACTCKFDSNDSTTSWKGPALWNSNKMEIEGYRRHAWGKSRWFKNRVILTLHKSLLKIIDFHSGKESSNRFMCEAFGPVERDCEAWGRGSIPRRELGQTSRSEPYIWWRSL